VRLGFDVFEWSFERVQSGPYELGIESPRVSIPIEVPPGATHDFVFHLPPPREACVCVVDAITGAELADAVVRWTSRARPTQVRDAVGAGKYDASRRCHVLRAPTDAIEVEVAQPLYRPDSMQLDLAHGAREHTVRLQPLCGVVVTLRDGETPVAWPDGDPGALRAHDGFDDGRRTVSPGILEVRYVVARGGKYTLELPRIPGYRVPTSRTIDIPAHGFLEHVVQLEREHR
jgi:hypothetical protein